MSISLPQGFRAAGVHCGIKENPDALDLALFVSEGEAVAAAVFTTNRVCGAPVRVSRERVPTASARGVVINSGNANACTGERGLEDARWMTEVVARQLGCRSESILVCSTGVIGHPLPRQALEDGLPRVVESLDVGDAAFHNAARAMMTTDTVPKQSTRVWESAKGPIRVSGAAKGAAMIAPNMATMLAVITTDAALSPAAADALLREAVDETFNLISVEGHTSTSDTVVLLANGRSRNGGDDLSDDETAAVGRMIREVCDDLAEAIINDAEGADHLVIVDVTGLPTRAEACRIAKTVAESPLVKTAIAGCDPNWGRIVSAAGYAGVEFDETQITLMLNGTCLFRDGAPVDYDEQAVAECMRRERTVHIALQFPLGEAGVRFRTCDLTTEYVRLNSEYTT